MPTGTTALVTVVSPTRPWIVVGPPVADSSQSVGTATPPAVFETALTRVKVGGMAVLVIVQVTSWSRPIVTVPFVTGAPTQTQSDAV